MQLIGLTAIVRSPSSFQREHIDGLAALVSKLGANDVNSALHGSHESQPTSGRGTAELTISGHRQIPEGDNRQCISASSFIAVSIAAALNAEHNALRLKTALFKARSQQNEPSTGSNKI